jgi:hypothetical protein
MHEKILGRWSAESCRLREVSVEPENLKDTYLIDVNHFIETITNLELIIIQMIICNEDATYCTKETSFLTNRVTQ